MGSTVDMPAELPLGRRLYLAHRTMHDLIDGRMAEHGASLWNWVLLRSACESDGSSQREIAERMHIEPPTLVRHLDKLEQEGLVERRPDPDDRRVVRVVVTPAGHERLRELHDVVHQLDDEVRGILTKRDVEVLNRALPRINAYFESKPISEVSEVEVSDARR
jgi:MarR family transcriptional regulator for hemolysin